MLVYYVLKGNQLKHYSLNNSDTIRSMAENQAFCLRRSNHSSDMIQVFERMFKDESMTDCALMCSEGHTLKAHRMVLSASSPFFKSVFEQMSNQSNLWPNYPIIYLKDMDIMDLKAIVEFIYRGEVTVDQTQLNSLLKSGESLRIKGLIDIDPRDVGSNTVTTISRKQKRRRHRKKSSNENLKNSERPEDDKNEENRDYNSSDDYISDYSEGDCTQLEDSPTDMSGSRTYNESVGASEDGIEPSKLLEQSMITGDTQESNSINHFSSSAHIMSPTNEDIKPIIYEESIGIMAQISNNDYNSNSSLNHTSNETQTPLIHPYDSSGIPSIPGTSSSQRILSSGEKRKSKTSKKSLHSRLSVQSVFHNRQQRFHCHICHQGFTAKRNLQRHMQIHNYYRNKFECELCQRQFSWKHTLNIHKEKAHNIKI